MLDIPTDDDLTTALWTGLIEIAAAMPNDWTLVGAQMVFLHGLEHGLMPPRRTTDMDVIVNVRALSKQPQEFVQGLQILGYDLEGISADNVGHRFVKSGLKIDVLLPDNIGPRAPREVKPGVRSVQVPGGTQALARSTLIEVRTRSASGLIPRPSLLGAILVKARAVDVDDLPDAQREDLAFLLTLVSEPFLMATKLRGGERGWLRRRGELLDPQASAWRIVDRAEDGQAALRILADAGA